MSHLQRRHHGISMFSLQPMVFLLQGLIGSGITFTVSVSARSTPVCLEQVSHIRIICVYHIIKKLL